MALSFIVAKPFEIFIVFVTKEYISKDLSIRPQKPDSTIQSQDVLNVLSVLGSEIPVHIKAKSSIEMQVLYYLYIRYS